MVEGLSENIIGTQVQRLGPQAFVRIAGGDHQEGRMGTQIDESQQVAPRSRRQVTVADYQRDAQSANHGGRDVQGRGGVDDPVRSQEPFEAVMVTLDAAGT